MNRTLLAIAVSAILTTSCGDSGTDRPAAVSEPDAPVDAVPETSDPDPASGVGPDPEARNTVRVDYDITVPAYISDALQVRLVRGEDHVAATWNGDEFWSVSEELPTGTETAPVVTFLDDDGGITLGTAELGFTTGTNAA